MYPEHDALPIFMFRVHSFELGLLSLGWSLIESPALSMKIRMIFFAFVLGSGHQSEYRVHQEECLIFDRGDATYVGVLVHGIKPYVSIHVARWCVVDILRLLLGLVNNDGRYKAFTSSSCEYKSVAPECYELSSFYPTHYFP